MKRLILCSAAIALFITSCKKDDPIPEPAKSTPPNLVFKFKFDSTQVRLNNIGNPSTIPAGNSGQSPVFNLMSAHYIELAPNQFTALGAGAVLYKNATTTAGGSAAIDFSQGIRKGNGEVFFSIPLSQVTAGTYQWLRVSLAYQNYDIKFKSGNYYGTGTIASFIGYNTYIGTYTIKTQPVVVNSNELQGYWGFEATVASVPYVASGQAPPGATTVPNPLFATSPIPQGSCVVTAAFANSAGTASSLVITGSETQDINVVVSLSTNKSFEWKDANMDGWFEPAATNPAENDTVVDMGIRGMIPFIQ
jgi:hypothetical protein